MIEKKLSDYKELDFNIVKTDLSFDIFEDYVEVESELRFVRVNKEASLIELDGVDLKLISVMLDGETFTDYQQEKESLKLNIARDEFILKIKVQIDPFNNTSCEGLYKSGDILCTQNEAEGFRKITYYYDRPDAMSVFTTRVSGDKAKYPKLLSNGNLIDSGELEAGRHFAVWEDPFKKPSYLYALVAGDLAVVKDKFTTMNKRVVGLEIYVDHGNEDKCGHAIESLKNSMKWDEQKYGLEYDLDIYMIVAVDTFNMGAIENKGLNIFNSAYVLAKQETATDHDFQGVEAVIGHEYFHNWTGNRVTCRDWFQLTLKEGLTVYRDQEFSSDMLSRAVKRIEDVKALRGHQFAEDASPLSHPIKPKSYVEMNNFYTATVYEKGAEVIRMIETLVSKDGFRKGMDLYFERHDGQAVTTEDFVAAMSDANNLDLEQFKVWYDQNGTPVVTIDEVFENGSYTLTLEQEAKLNNDKYKALHIPLKIALFNTKGEKVEDCLIELKEPKQSFSFELKEKPVLSFNRNFTAPIIVNDNLSIDDLLFLMKFDDDEFNRYEACLNIYKKIIAKYIANEEVDLKSVYAAFKSILEDSTIDNAFKAYALEVPSYQTVILDQSPYLIEESKSACEKLKFELARELEEQMQVVYSSLLSDKFDTSSSSMGNRALKNLLLSYMSLLDGNKDKALNQYSQATNMTDEIAGLKNLYLNYNDEDALESFYNKWKDETLVIQKWFALQAINPKISIEELRKLEQNPSYDIKVPNLVRSVVGHFIGANLVKMVTKEGFEYACEKILEIDKINPQVASRFTKGLSFLSKISSESFSRLKESWESFASNEFSKDVGEVVISIKESI